MDVITSKTITSLRFPLACLIVFIHGRIIPSGWSQEAVDFQNLQYVDISSLFITSISSVVASVAVPLFFFISGYLFFVNFRTWNWNEWNNKIKSRVHSLLIPYFLWMSLSFLFIFLVGIITGHGASAFIDTWNEHNGLIAFYSAFIEPSGFDWLGNITYVSFPIFIPLWFIRDLMVLVLLSPLLYLCLFCKKRYNIIFIILLAASYMSRIFPFIPGLTITPLFMFAIGGGMAIYCIDFVKICNKMKLPAIIIFIFLFFVLLYTGVRTRIGSIIHPWFIVVGSIAFIAVGAVLANRTNILYKWNAKLASATFFIYVFHPFILPYIGKIIDLIVKNIYQTQEIGTILFANTHPLIFVFSYLLKVLITIIICVISYSIFRTSFPKICRIMCGGK